MASFWSELRRRNVFKVAVAYAIVAWLLIQIIETIFPVLQLPDWSVTLVTAMILIGFPLALIFAWAFEVTPEGIKLDKDVKQSDSIRRLTGRNLDFAIIAVLSIAVAYFAIDEFLVDRAPPGIPPTGDDYRETTPESSQWTSSIAVLPFVNMSPDPENEFFSDGLSAGILNMLTRVRNLKVIAQSSSFAFKGKDIDLREIGGVLGVETVLEGSVFRSGDRVRVSAQLVDVADGSNLWSESYDRVMTDILIVQDDVATEIIDALQMQIGAATIRDRPTDNFEAYALYLQAIPFLKSQEGYDALPLLLRAVELDPDFAKAYELLAYSYWQQSGSIFTVEDAERLMVDAANRALEFDPDLGFAQAILHQSGPVIQDDVSFISALKQARLAEPGNTILLRPLIYSLENVGYLREAIQIARQYVELDPLASAAHYSLGEALYASGQKEAAIEHLTFAFEQGNYFAAWYLPAVHLIERRDDEAITLLEIAVKREGVSDTAWVRELVHGARDPVNGKAFLERRMPEMVATMPEGSAMASQFVLPAWYLYIGFLDDFYQSMFDAGLDPERWTSATVDMWVGTVLRQNGFTAHSKYPEVAERLGIAQIWDLHGPPDFCEKAESRWVCE